MEINLGYDFEKNQFISNEEKELNNDEVEYLKKLIITINKDNLNIIKNCDDYTTLTYKGGDLVRVKIGIKSQWIKLFIHPKYKKNVINDEIFKNQKNKNQLFWIIDFNTPIETYLKYVLRTITEIDNFD